MSQCGAGREGSRTRLEMGRLVSKAQVQDLADREERLQRKNSTTETSKSRYLWVYLVCSFPPQFTSPCDSGSASLTFTRSRRRSTTKIVDEYMRGNRCPRHRLVAFRGRLANPAPSSGDDGLWADAPPADSSCSSPLPQPPLR